MTLCLVVKKGEKRMAVHALVMGFGGTGAHILTYLKEMAVLKNGKKPDSIKFLLFDTIAKEDWKPGETVQIAGGAGGERVAQGQEISLDPNNEYYYLEDSTPSLKEYTNRYLAPNAATVNQYPHLKDWLHTSWLGKHIAPNKLNIKDGAAQQRQIGRFALFQNVPAIIQFLNGTLTELRNKAGAATVQVWLIGSVAGGTGAGTMLDAAFITRLMETRLQLQGIQLSGVFVLPEIYRDQGGISQARAYSLFRELERFQEMGVPNHDRYLVNNTECSSEVSYDKTGQQRSFVPSRLFDNLFYLGTPCTKDDQRTAFFTSVANAIDPYLDDQQGPPLLQQSVNPDGASSFGAARLYIPKETYAELFAWDEVYAFIAAITAPKKESNQIIDVYSGEQADRQKAAKEKVKGLLPLFEELLTLEGKTDEHITAFAKTKLVPENIVTDWYQLGGTGILDGLKLTPADKQKTVLAYTNPYFSLEEANLEKIDNIQIRVKTYKENKIAKGIKEKQDESRDRFAEELVQCTQAYTSDAKGSFKDGRKLVLKVLSEYLSNKIDTLIENEFTQNPDIAWDNNAQDQGTIMTRLSHEISWILLDLNNLFKNISTCLLVLNQEEGTRSQQVVNAANTLKNSSAKFFGTWVEELQNTAREECGEYIRWYQNRELLKDMQELVNRVKARFIQWANVFKTVVQDLAVSHADRGHPAILESINNDHQIRLNGRLHRLARNPNALISCEPKLADGSYDIEMQGYRDVLRNLAVADGQGKRLSDQILDNAHWEAKVDSKTGPQLNLVAKWGNNQEAIQPLPQFYQELYKYFRTVIDAKLSSQDIFDYLLYAQNKDNNLPQVVTNLLKERSSILLNTPAIQTEKVNWVYQAPQDSNKQNLATTLQAALNGAGNPATLHSDPNALTLMRICLPANDEVTNLTECKNAYMQEQMDDLTREDTHDKALYRAQVYHPFRAELEAWYIERMHYHHQLQEVIDTDKQITPRVTRLLEHPEMMQVFVRCIATKAIEKDDDKQIWVFHNSAMKKDIELTTNANPNADVMSAAVTFVLRQQEAKQGGRVQIILKHAKDSAVNAAQQADKNVNEMVEAFVGKPTEPDSSQQLDSFLDENFDTAGLDYNIAEREKQNLKIIFQFYGDKKRRTHLGDRMLLP